MKVGRKLAGTIIWLIVSVIVFVYTFVTGAIVIDGGISLYPDGTDWMCVIGFAIISLPAILSIIKEIFHVGKSNQKYYNEHKDVTIWTDSSDRVKKVSVDDMSFEKLLGWLLPIIAGCVLVYFIGFYMAVGFTIYRLVMLFVYSSKLKKQKSNTTKKSNYRSTGNAKPSISIDNQINPKINMFSEIESVGYAVNISASDFAIIQNLNPATHKFDWNLDVGNIARLSFYSQGLEASVDSRSAEYKQKIYAVMVSKDCSALNKKRGEHAFFLVTTTANVSNGRGNLYFLQGEAEQIAIKYLNERLTQKPFLYQIYSNGKYPIMLPGKDGSCCAVLPLATGTYQGAEYVLASAYENVIPGVERGDKFIMRLGKLENEPLLTVVQDDDLHEAIYDHCFDEY